MTITYPLTPPANPTPRRVDVSARVAAGLSVSPFSFAAQAQRWAGEAWAFRVEFPPMNDASAAAWRGFLLALSGTYGTFLWGETGAKAPQGNWAGAPAVNGAGQTGRSLAIGGLTPGATVKAGDLFQLGTGGASRLHAALADATADGSGHATLDIWPALRASPGDGDVVVVNTPKGVFRLAAAPPFSRSMKIWGLALDIVEAL